MSTTVQLPAKDSRRRDLRRLHFVSIVVSVLTISLTYLASELPLFDSSPELLVPPSDNVLAKVTFPLLRWDAFHFVHIAQDGYIYEHEWAFFPGAPFIMRTSGEIVKALGARTTVAHLLAGGGLACLLCGSTTTLYDLTLRYFESPSIAYLTCLLSLLPSSPVTLRFSTYTEPFFTYFSYRGMLVDPILLIISDHFIFPIDKKECCVAQIQSGWPPHYFSPLRRHFDQMAACL